MPTQITRDEVARLAREENGQIIDVLPRWEYDEEHLVGAISLPLKRFDRDTTTPLETDRPVIAYCHDYL